MSPLRINSDSGQVGGRVSGRRKLQSKQRHDYRRSLEQYEQSSNASAKTRNERDFLAHRRDMRKLCCSLPRDTRRMCEIL
jgi:hypothetical protein